MASSDRFGFASTSLTRKRLVGSAYNLREYVQSFGEPCSQFHSPLSLLDKLYFYFIKKVSTSPLLRSIVVVPLHNISPNWQILLNFLFKKRVISKPEFTISERTNDSPLLYRIHLTGTHHIGITDGRILKKITGSCNGTRLTQEVLSKCVGEMLERFFLTLYNKNVFTTASYRTLKKRRGVKVFDITSASNFSTWQKNINPQLGASEDDSLKWILGEEIISGKPAYIPAQHVFWNYAFNENEKIISQPTTNGAAGHFKLVDATVASLHELVQRDSFLIFWLNTISPIRIRIEEDSDTELGRLFKKTRQLGIKVHFLDITSDIPIPSCVCALVDDRLPESIISIGASAGFNIETCLLSSLLEALGVNDSLALSTKRFPIDNSYIPFSDKSLGLHERIFSWKGPEMKNHFSFFIAGNEELLHQTRFASVARMFQTSNEELSYVLGIFRDMGLGYEVYRYTVQHQVLRKLNYYVTKIAIPKLVPMYLTENMATLGSSRLTQVPKKLGFKDARLNPWPHPFP